MNFLIYLISYLQHCYKQRELERMCIPATLTRDDFSKIQTWEILWLRFMKNQYLLNLGSEVNGLEQPFYLRRVCYLLFIFPTRLGSDREKRRLWGRFSMVPFQTKGRKFLLELTCSPLNFSWMNYTAISYRAPPNGPPLDTSVSYTHLTLPTKA